MSRKRLHAKRFGRVVAAVKNVDPQFLGQRGGPVRAFSGNEGNHASAAALARLPPAPPVTIPIFRQTLGPPLILTGGAPSTVFNRLPRMSRHSRVEVRRPMNWPRSSKKGLGFLNRP